MTSQFCASASAVPRYQPAWSRVMKGRRITIPLSPPSRSHAPAGAGLPGKRGGDQMRGVEVLVVREVRVAVREVPVQRGGVIGAQVLVAHAGPEGEVLAVGARAQGEGALVPVLEPGPEIRGHL